jgi:hypothetical protein
LGRTADQTHAPLTKIGKIIREDGPESHIEKLGNTHHGRFYHPPSVIILTILMNAATEHGFDIPIIHFAPLAVW